MTETSDENYQHSQSISDQTNRKKFSTVLLKSILGICILGFSAFYIGWMIGKTQDGNPQLDSTSKEQTGLNAVSTINQVQVVDANSNISPINNSCDKNSCLFEDKSNDAVIGFATVEGYYQSYDKKDWGEVDVKCDAIVVTKGNTALIDNLLKWVKQGNTINSINDKGELILNINLGSISENYQRQIKSSTISNPIKLDVIRILPQGRGALSCTSFVDIIAAR